MSIATPQTRRRRILLAVGLGLPLVFALVLLSVYLGRTPSSGQTERVVVAKQDLAAGAALTADNTTLVERTVDTVPSGALLQQTQANGKFVVIHVAANTIISSDMLTSDANSAQTVAKAGFQLKDGDVAMSLPVDEMTGAGGYIVAGDRIDILVDLTSDNPLVKYGFQDVLVLKVGAASAAAEATPKLLMVELTRGEAKMMGTLLDAGNSGSTTSASGTGKVSMRYVLRPRDQFGKGDLPTTDYVPPSDDRQIDLGRVSQLFQLP